MSQIFLFRFHNSYDVCVQTLKLLRKFNPDIPIHGMYGGNDTIKDLPADLMNLMDTVWAIPLDDPYYKWLNGDLCVRWWFKDHGHKFAFDHLILTEWDMIFTKPVKDFLPSLAKNTNYASIFGDYEHAKSFEWHWVFDEHYAYKTEKLLTLLKKDGMHIDLKKLHFAVMGGAVMCREFLERYSSIPVPSYSNDELRFCVYSKAFDIPIKDNGFYSKKNFFGADADKYEECTEEKLQQLQAQGGSVIHPVRNIIEDIENILAK